MNLDDVMEEVGARLDTIEGLRVAPYPADRVTPPQGVVGYPDVRFDDTMARGMDRYDMPVWVIVGLASDRAAKKVMTPFVAGSGPSSVKAVLESAGYQSLDSLRVVSATPTPMTVAEVDYLAYQFTLDIAGQGA